MSQVSSSSSDNGSGNVPSVEYEATSEAPAVDEILTHNTDPHRIGEYSRAVTTRAGLAQTIYNVAEARISAVRARIRRLIER